MPQSALKRVRAIWALVSGPKLTKSDLDPACSAKQGFSLLATAAGREPATSASKAVLYPVELRGQPRERRSFCSGSEVASGLSQALARTSFFGEAQALDFACVSSPSGRRYWVRSGLIPS